MFLSLHNPATTPIEADACHNPEPVREPGYILWGLVNQSHQSTQRDPESLGESGAVPWGPAGQSRRSAYPDPLGAAQHLLAGWSPRVRSLVSASEPDTVTAFPYLAADPDAHLTPWPARDVTALGDAVHAMPPTGGRGAATAIRDADLLATQLINAHHGRTTAALAIHDFHRQMPTYAVAALRESLQPLRWQRLTTPAPVFAVAHAALRVTGAWQRCRDRTR